MPDLVKSNHYKYSLIEHCMLSRKSPSSRRTSRRRSIWTSRPRSSPKKKRPKSFASSTRRPSTWTWTTAASPRSKTSRVSVKSRLCPSAGTWSRRLRTSRCWPLSGSSSFMTIRLETVAYCLFRGLLFMGRSRHLFGFIVTLLVQCLISNDKQELGKKEEEYAMTTRLFLGLFVMPQQAII